MTAATIDLAASIDSHMIQSRAVKAGEMLTATAVAGLTGIALANGTPLEV